MSLKPFGAPDTNRTCDLPLRRGLLYPLSYRGEVRILLEIPALPQQVADA